MVKQTIWISAAATATQVLLGALLISQYGLAGLFAASVVAQLVMLIPYSQAMSARLGVSWRVFSEPLKKLTIVALLAAASHMLIQSLRVDSVAARLALACAVMGMHYLASYRFLLSEEERDFLWERFHVIKSRIAVSSGVH